MRDSRQQSAARVEPSSSVVVPFPVPESDIGLVTALRAGHADAIRVLCERHSGQLLRVAARILGPDEALVPVVVEAVQRSLEMLDQLEEPRTLGVWLVSRLIVATRHRLRARRRWRWVVPRKLSAAPPKVHHYSEQLLVCYRVLDRMNDNQRIVFCLVVIHSMGLAEVATAFGDSLAQVRSTLEKACRSFEHHFESELSVSVRNLRSA